uniref:Activin_recp domain-containing protein n=1 Tax=Caenorhabditis tropicalis TaxID=1561998 RepID=A0A1I7T591_9PELO
MFLFTVMKLRCHQCNQPHDCSTGVCYGDICVKSLVNNHYVSKGCENLTISSSVYEPHLKMRTYCKEEEVCVTIK